MHCRSLHGQGWGAWTFVWTGTQPGGCRVATIPPAAGAGFKTPQDRDALDVGKVPPQSFASQLSISGGGGGV